MVSPLLFVFLVNLFVHLVNTLGATTINELVRLIHRAVLAFTVCYRKR